MFFSDTPLFFQLFLKDGDTGIRLRQETGCLVFFVDRIHKRLGQCLSEKIHRPSGVAGHAFWRDRVVCEEMLDAMATRLDLTGRAGDADPRPLVERLHADRALSGCHICQRKMWYAEHGGIHM